MKKPAPSLSFHQAIAACVLQLGKREFFDAFFDLINSCFGADQCMVFRRDSEGKLTNLLFKNFRKSNLAKPLARDYVEGGYHKDPNLQALLAIGDGETKIIHLDSLSNQMPEEYREHYFTDPELKDKVSIITGDGVSGYYINIYRSPDKSRFKEDGLFTEVGTGELIAALIVQHYQLNANFLQEGPLAFLSEREQQVCRGILQGKKIEAVAYELNLAPSSIVTYRKRAYDKLGISTRAALFALCIQDQEQV